MPNLKAFRWICFAPLMALSVAATAATYDYNDYTDVWCVSTGCNGSGINLVQNNDTIYVSFYIYDATGNPVWTSSDLHRSQSNRGPFKGKLYSPRAAFSSSPFNPSQVIVEEIGNVTLTPVGINEITLEYTAHGALTTHTISRYALEELLIGGLYWGGATIKRDSCASTNNNKTTFNSISLNVEKKSSSTQATFKFYISNYECTLKGTLKQEGRYQKIDNANYVCYLGSDKILDSKADLFNITTTTQGIEGQWSAKKGLNSCKEETHFSAVATPE